MEPFLRVSHSTILSISRVLYNAKYQLSIYLQAILIVALAWVVFCKCFCKLVLIVIVSFGLDHGDISFRLSEIVCLLHLGGEA